MPTITDKIIRISNQFRSVLTVPSPIQAEKKLSENLHKAFLSEALCIIEFEKKEHSSVVSSIEFFEDDIADKEIISKNKIILLNGLPDTQVNQYIRLEQSFLDNLNQGVIQVLTNSNHKDRLFSLAHEISQTQWHPENALIIPLGCHSDIAYLICLFNLADITEVDELMEKAKQVSLLLSYTCEMVKLENKVNYYNKEALEVANIQGIWSEALIWLNQAGNKNEYINSPDKFFQDALFQISILTHSDGSCISFLGKDLKVSHSTCLKGNNKEFTEIEKYINSHDVYDIFSEYKILSNTQDKYSGHITIESIFSEHDKISGLIVQPIYVNKTISAVIFTYRQNGPGIFLYDEEILLYQFIKGIENILKSFSLLRSLKRNNLLLEQEKKEQEKLIKKLKTAQTQLLQSEKMSSIGQLAAGVAHEINNPIGFVNSNLQSLKQYEKNLFELIDTYQSADQLIKNHDEQLGKVINDKKEAIDFEFIKEDLSDLLEESYEGLNRVINIVKDLKDFSHVSETRKEITNLTDGIEKTLNIVSNELKYKAEIIKNYKDIPDIECVATEINQVFLNLLVNSGQAIKEYGTITINTYQPNDTNVCIEIADTGQGIPQDKIDKIFDPFFTTKPVGKGTGLGLSVCYGIIEKHGGKIEVESEENVGTTFKIILPIKHKLSKDP